MTSCINFDSNILFCRLYVTNGGQESCQGPSPIVQVSSRSGDVATTDGTPPQPFTDWSLDGYFTGIHTTN